MLWQCWYHSSQGNHAQLGTERQSKCQISNLQAQLCTQTCLDPWRRLLKQNQRSVKLCHWKVADQFTVRFWFGWFWLVFFLPPPHPPSASIALYLPKMCICHLEERAPGMQLAQHCNGREVKQVRHRHLCPSLMLLFPLPAHLHRSHTAAGWALSRTAHTWKRRDTPST